MHSDRRNICRIFEDAVAFAHKYIDFIPLTFMLGFFVTIVVNRWWDMFLNIGWIDRQVVKLDSMKYESE